MWNKRKHGARVDCSLIVRLLAALSIGWLLLPSAAQAFSDNADVDRFIDRMVEEHHFSAEELQRFFATLTPNDRAIDLMDKPLDPTRRTYWNEYRRRHVSANMIRDGVRFLRRHSDIFDRAHETFGVPPAIIAAIIGVETRYGNYLGKFNIAQVLATFAFYYERRAAFFSGELEQFLLYTRENQLASTQMRGSYAGAFGIPQFLPSSARNYAVDFDADGRINLFSPTDAIGSVGNFLREHGWQAGMNVAYRIESADAAIEQLDEAGTLPSLHLGDFAAYQPVFRTSPDAEELLTFIQLENRLDKEYFAGTGNYYALTRYNRSRQYAIAVWLLASEIARRMGG